MKLLKLALGAVLALSSFGASNSFAGDHTCTIPDRFKVESSDVARLERLETTRSLGLAAALSIENSGDRLIISELFANEFAPIVQPDRVIGDYQCRTIKLGGNLPGIVYGWFACEIFPEEAVLVIRKITGSQRFFGLLAASGDKMSYRGALHYGYEVETKFYGEDPERNQVGCLSAVDASMNHLVLELPAPKFESVHDVIEMKRVQ